MLFIGLQSESLPTVTSGQISVSVDGNQVVSEQVTAEQGTFAAHETRVLAPAGKSDARVDVKIEAFSAPGTPAVLTRFASTHFVPGQTFLLRLKLDTACVSGLPVSIPTPVCIAPQTCFRGLCVDGNVPPQDLEPYTQSWATPTDICKPAGAGPPEVILGVGQTDYNPLANGTTLQLEKGPQGGYHVWTAVRMRNLRQSGSTTTISGAQPGENPLPPTALIFTFDRDEGGYCKLYGMRFVVANSDADVEKFLGKPMDITVEVKDSTGASARSTARVNIGTVPIK